MTKGMESDYYVEISGDELEEGLQVVIPTDAVSSGSDNSSDKSMFGNMGTGNMGGGKRGGMGGGAPGVIVGIVLGAVAAAVIGYSAAAPVAAIVIAVAFSMIIGVFFGYYPANKAAKLNPIDALRYE